MNRYRDEALEMADFNEKPMTHDEIRARNLRFEVARANRVRKGLPPFKTLVRQKRRDSDRYPECWTQRPDPILDLHAVRDRVLRAPWEPANQQRYGELLQTVVSPVCLP